jgi:hypothetical protein
MTIHDLLDAERLKIAWAVLPQDKKEAIRPLIDAAHEQLRTFANTRKATHRPDIPHQLLLAKTAITNDEEGLVPRLPGKDAAASPQAEVEIDVSPGGEIYGTGMYQQLDPGWVEAAGIWIERLIIGRHGFPSGQPSIIPIPDDVTIAMAGDWGTGPFNASPNPSQKIANFIKALNPDYTIHLGDVYYSGTNTQETNNFVSLWPAGSLGSFALNSNHEMYSGGGPYFTEAVSGGKFDLQKPFSFFALENANWIIVGLDSAYFSDELQAYMNGSIGDASPGKDAQTKFLSQIAAKAEAERKSVIVLTHHNGLQEDGSAPMPLWNEIMAAFPNGTAPAYWYWGHVHAGIAYARESNGVRCRCTGHGALPWGFASELQNNASVVWFERRNAGDPQDKLRVFNGCAVLQLSGAKLIETFIDENGKPAWTPSEGAAAT